MDKVYFITSGNYSDYHIDAIFSTKERADEFLAIARQNDEISNSHYKDQYRVEEHELDKVDLKNDDCWQVTISGATGEVRSQEWHLPTSHNETYRSNHDVIGYGRTPEHARRSAEEFRRVLLTTPAKWYISITYYHDGFNDQKKEVETFTDTLLAFKRCEELEKNA